MQKPKGKQDKVFSGNAVPPATKRKITLYTPLMGLATKQAVDGLRSKRPEFLAVACSTLGEWGQGTFRLQEWLTSKYAGKLADEGPQDNGDPVEKLTAAFRNKFRMNMYVAVARGVAKQMLECGLP